MAARRLSHVVAEFTQVLYGRRGFPYYAFCVVAGIDNHCDFDSREGAVYVYDAIRSYERVAVGCSGTGREMLQPILDCLSSESSRRRIDDDDNKLQQRIDYTNNANGAGGGDGDIMSVPAGDQRYGVAHGELFVGGGSSECCAGISSCR